MSLQIVSNVCVEIWRSVKYKTDYDDCYCHFYHLRCLYDNKYK